MLLYSVNAITDGHRCAGRGHRAAASRNGRIVNGLGADTDIIVASARRIINALNKLHGKQERLKPAVGGVSGVASGRLQVRSARIDGERESAREAGLRWVSMMQALQRGRGRERTPRDCGIRSPGCLKEKRRGCRILRCSMPRQPRLCRAARPCGSEERHFAPASRTA